MAKPMMTDFDQVVTDVAYWNVIVTVKPHHYGAAVELLEGLGEVVPTDYQNVLALKVTDVGEFLEALHERMEVDREAREAIAHVGAGVETFTFGSVQEFEAKAKELAMRFEPEMVGRAFHVRMHRRNWKGQLESAREERELVEYLLGAFQQTSQQSRVDFDDPDVILALEVLDNRAGIALWTRANRAEYPFLNVD